MSAMAPTDQHTELASPAGMRRRVAVGTQVESRKYEGSVCDENGRRWERGTVVDHDSDLDLPVVRWENGLTEAVERYEYEVEQ